MNEWESRFHREIEKRVYGRVKQIWRVWTQNETRFCSEGTCDYEDDILYVEYATMDGSVRTECLDESLPDFLRSL